MDSLNNLTSVANPTEEIKQQNHIFNLKRVSRVFFYESKSLGFIKSHAKRCTFIEPTNLIFHNSLITDTDFRGRLVNLIFDNCRLARVSFDKAKLVHVQFLNQTKIKDVTGLPDLNAQPIR